MSDKKSIKVVDLAYAQAEKPIPGAPIIEMNDDHGCIPQHFLTYNHSYESVAAIINDIEFSDKYPVFVCKDETGLYIQVGIIGYDNYKPKSKNDPQYIVYGRKWRVEPNLPSGEVIQTIFLALKKAREHELRELLRLKNSKTGKRSTPFSGHHDIPYMAQIMPTMERCSNGYGALKENELNVFLQQLDFDQEPFELHGIEKCKNGKYVIDLEIVPPADSKHTHVFSTLLNTPFSILVDNLQPNTLYHAIMAELIVISDRSVDENFKYRGFKRFSHKNSIDDIGEISIMLRNNKALNDCPEFFVNFKNTNYNVDATRVPLLHHHDLTQKIIDQLKSFGRLQGHLPKHISS